MVAKSPGRVWEPELGVQKGVRPGAAAKAQAQQLLDEHDELLNPDDIDDPEVRAAYLDGLFEEEFGERPSRRKNAHIDDPAGVGAGAPAGSPSPAPGRAGPAGRAGRTPSPSRPSGTGSSWTSSLPSLGGDGSGFALGLVLYALGINYIRYGPAGLKGWLSAKFLNKPLQPTSTQE